MTKTTAASRRAFIAGAATLPLAGLRPQAAAMPATAAEACSFTLSTLALEFIAADNAHRDYCNSNAEQADPEGYDVESGRLSEQISNLAESILSKEPEGVLDSRR